MTDILAIRKMQIKTTVRYYLTHVGMVTIKKTQEIGSVGKDMEKREPLNPIGGNTNWYSPYGKQYGSSSKT